MSKWRNTILICGGLWSLLACGGGGNSTPASSGNNNSGTPAQVGGLWAGVWMGTGASAGLEDQVVVELRQTGSSLTGYATIAYLGLSNALLTGTVSGNTFTFGDINKIVQYTGTVNASDAAQGTYHESSYGTDGSWAVRRLMSEFSDASPASVAGSWSLVSVSSMGHGNTPQTASITQSGADIGGTVAGSDIWAGRISGNVAWFAISSGVTANSVAAGTFDTSSGSGTYLVDDVSASTNPYDKGTWTASKN